MRAWLKNEDGASALEFALVFPIFVTMMFGTMQMGLAFYYAGSVQYALERTARTVMVDQDMSTGEVQAAFHAELAIFTTQNVPLSYTIDNSGSVPIAQFSAVYNHEFVIPFVPSFDIPFDVETRVPLEPPPS